MRISTLDCGDAYLVLYPILIVRFSNITWLAIVLLAGCNLALRQCIGRKSASCRCIGGRFMITIRYGVWPFLHSDIDTAHSDGKTSSSWRLRVESITSFFGFSPCIALLILVVSLALVAELAVVVLVGADFALASKVYHEVILPRHHADEPVMTSDSEIAEASPRSTNSSAPKRETRPSNNRSISTQKGR